MNKSRYTKNNCWRMLPYGKMLYKGGLDMQKYVCSICGFVYDESSGYEKDGIALNTKWEDVPDTWVCPLCGATKGEFVLQIEKEKEAVKTEPMPDEEEIIRELSVEELSALCSNLAKGCEKQYRQEEALSFKELADFYNSKSISDQNLDFHSLLALMEDDLNNSYTSANKKATALKDRGAMRALTWNEKVTRILYSLLKRYEDQKDVLLENTNVYVCEICGFVYIGDMVPEICPVCKVPSLKIVEIPKGVA